MCDDDDAIFLNGDGVNLNCIFGLLLLSTIASGYVGLKQKNIGEINKFYELIMQAFFW